MRFYKFSCIYFLNQYYLPLESVYQMSGVNSDYKKITKNTLMLYFRMFFSMFVTLYTSRVILDVLGVEDFGIYNVVGGIVVLFGFLNNAMAASTQRFLTFELSTGNINSLQKVFGVSLSIHFFIAIIILILAETIGLWMLNTKLVIPPARIIAANWVYQFSVFSFIFTVLTIPYYASIISHEKMNIYAFFGIIEVVLKLIIVFLLPFGNDKLIFYAFLIFIITILIRSFYILYCRRHFPESHVFFMWDKVLFKKMGSFANWNLLGVFAGIGYTQGVNILLNINFGPIINAARGIAFQVQSAVNSFVTNFQTALNPPIIRAYATNEKSMLYNLVFYSAKFSFFLLFIISLPIILNTEIVLGIWLKNIPDYAVIFTRLVLFDILVASLSGSMQILVQATGNIKKYQIIVSGILLLNLPVSFVVLRLGFLPQSTFIISICCSLLALFARIYIIKSLEEDFSASDFIKSVLLKVFLVFSLSLFVSYIIFNNYPEIPVQRFIVTSFISIFITLLFIYIFGINKKERSVIFNFILKHLKRKNEF